MEKRNMDWVKFLTFAVDHKNEQPEEIEMTMIGPRYFSCPIFLSCSRKKYHDGQIMWN